MEYLESKLTFKNQVRKNPFVEKKNTILTGKRFDHFKGLSMVLLGAILWGASGTAAQVLFQQYDFNPGWLVTVRMIISGLLLLVGISVRSGLKQTFAVWKDKRCSSEVV